MSLPPAPTSSRAWTWTARPCAPSIRCAATSTSMGRPSGSLRARAWASWSSKDWSRSMRSFLLALLVALGGGASLPHAPLKSAGQLVLVTTPGWDAPAGQLRRFERDGAGWREVGAPVAVTIGRAGAAWGLGLNPPQGD